MPSLGQFIAGRQAAWQELEGLLKRSDGNRLRSLTAAEVETLGRRYRQVVSDLAIASRDFPDDELTVSLNALAGRAHLRLYRERSASLHRLVGFFTVGFARRFRASAGYVAASAALLLLPAVAAYAAALTDAGLRQALVPAELVSVMEQGQTWTDIQAELRPAMAAVIFTNNIQVSFMAFAGGVLGGLGTAYVLARNGLMLGAVLGAAQYYGVGPLLAAFVSSHWYLEIFSITLAGASGLILGHAVLRPGLLRRRDALTRAARRALALETGVIPVLIVAGIVEGMVSPSGVAAEVKYALGPTLLLALLALLVGLGREPRTVADER